HRPGLWTTIATSPAAEAMRTAASALSCSVTTVTPDASGSATARTTAGACGGEPACSPPADCGTTSTNTEAPAARSAGARPVLTPTAMIDCPGGGSAIVPRCSGV